jgi:hypothetical protein
MFGKGKGEEPDEAEDTLPEHNVYSGTAGKEGPGEEAVGYPAQGGPSRRSRIARGSGTSVSEVGRLLKKFEKMRTMMKKMSKMSRNPAAAQSMFSKMGQFQGR